MLVRSDEFLLNTTRDPRYQRGILDVNVGIVVFGGAAETSPTVPTPSLGGLPVLKSECALTTKADNAASQLSTKIRQDENLLL